MGETGYSFNQALSSFNSSLQGLSTTVGAANLDKINRKFAQEEAEKQRLWNEEMYARQNAWNLEAWNKTNEYNTPTAQIQRLRDAGLNPLYYGLDGSSAKAYEAAQPLGYERADYQSVINPIKEGLTMMNQSRALAKDIELKNAQIDKIKEDTTSVSLDNEWKDKTMDARVQAEELSNALTKETISKINDERKNIQQEFHKIIAETDNEVRKGFLIEAQTNVSTMQAKEIAELLPYKKLLTEAQTEAQKAAAAASFAKAAIDRGLFNAGYVDKVIDGLVKDNRLKDANISSQESIAAINAFKSAIRTGNTFTINESDPGIQKFITKVFNGLFEDLSIIGEVITGPIAGVFK